MTERHQDRDLIRRITGFIETGVTLPAEAAAATFESLALELFQFQFDRNVPFQRLCQARRGTPSKVRHWTGIPAVPTAAFKELEFSCVTPRERTHVFHSSGTTSHKPGRHFHNVATLALYNASLKAWFQRHLLPAQPHGDACSYVEGIARPNMLSLTPSPDRAPHSSLAHMMGIVQIEFGDVHSRFTGRVTDAGWEVDIEATLHWIGQHVVLNRPLLVAGTAFNFVHLLDALIRKDRRFQLPPGSVVMETGGYKGRSREIPKTELHELISERLGVPSSGIVCEYGMSELSSQAYDHVAGEEGPRRFRFPPWVRARIISPENGREVADGGIGLIQVLDLANAWSVMSVVTEDLGRRLGDGFELIGRAGGAEARGCSLMTAPE